jgi:carbamoyltransferase
MIVLGLNAHHGDASAALFRDGELIAAVEEERFTRFKHEAGFPSNAIRYCLQTAGAKPQDIDHVAIPRKRSAHLFHKALWAMRMPKLAANRASVWKRFGDIKESIAHSLDVRPSDFNPQFHYVEHHIAHVSSSFYASPFQDAAVLSLDALGDFASMSWGTGRDRDLNIEGYTLFPHSLGLFYTAMTQYLGLWKYGDEYKVMGLAAYGEPNYADVFERIVRTGSNLDFQLDLKYFSHHRGDAEISWEGGEPEIGRLFSDDLEKVLGPARHPDEPVEKRHKDIAASLQWRLEEVLFSLLNQLHKSTGADKLCYGGGVAFNCAANGKIFDRTPFKEIYIQPAAGDAGLAVGSALYVQHQVLAQPRKFVMTHSYWGPESSPDLMKQAIERSGLSFHEYEIPELAEHTAAKITEGKIVGWFQGRSEWGPRALGDRSIVVDPRRADMQNILNERVKQRETFRPFAPSILEEKTGDWFEKDYPSPFMLMTYPVKPEKRTLIPAPTHVDGTGRLQTVCRATNRAYWELISAFERQTGVPLLLNTSFNEREPIVNTPEEAIACFERTGMDVLALGPYLLERSD